MRISSIYVRSLGHSFIRLLASDPRIVVVVPETQLTGQVASIYRYKFIWVHIFHLSNTTTLEFRPDVNSKDNRKSGFSVFMSFVESMNYRPSRSNSCTRLSLYLKPGLFFFLFFCFFPPFCFFYFLIDTSFEAARKTNTYPNPQLAAVTSSAGKKPVEPRPRSMT